MKNLSDPVQEQEIEAAQRRATELANAGASLEEALEELVCVIEEVSRTDVKGSILILDETGKHLRHGAAPSLPAAYCEAIDGIAIGPSVGSCGTAAYNGHIIMVRDIANDPLWRDFKDLALEHGLRSCWSIPIRSTNDKIFGTFALYHGEIRSPTAGDRKTVERLNVTAAEVIQLSRAAL